MSEFLFRNLSVRLFPAAAEGPEGGGCSPACSAAWTICGPCSLDCSLTQSVACNECSRIPSVVCPACSVVSCGPCSTVTCGACSTQQSCCGGSVAVSICQGACSALASVCNACSNAPSICICTNLTCPGASVACRVGSLCPGGSIVCPGGSVCAGGSACGGSVIDPTRPVTEVRAELAALKQQLRQALAEVEATEEQLASRAKPRTPEEIDRLKDELLAAVAELDEQRRQMGASEGPAST